jgi:alpha-1,6-mannosyltransferase
MYSWIHVILATACAVAAWYSLSRAPEHEPASGQ